MKNIALPIGIFILAVLAGIAIMVLPGKSSAPGTNNNATTTPTTNQWPVVYKDVLEVASPTITKTQIVVSGKARTWYFEASFPIELKDSAGNTIAQVPAQAQGDWMTSDFVPFSATLTFPAQPSGSSGTLILHKDNPSGLPENDDQKSIPITFQ